MSLIKTNAEIETMKKGGQILSKVLQMVIDAVHSGVRICDLDALAEKELLARGATPSFKNYQSNPSDIPFPSTLCVSVNEEVVHGLGNRKHQLQEGDVVGIDTGCWFEGLCTDMAITVSVGEISSEAKKLLKVTRQALFDGVNAAIVGAYLSEVSLAIEECIKPHGFGIVEVLGGHGVGHAVHESPFIPNFTLHQYQDLKLKDGMCLALEPLVVLGTCHVKTAEDQWAVIMEDCQISAHFEVTIAIRDSGTEIL